MAKRLVLWVNDMHEEDSRTPVYNNCGWLQISCQHPDKCLISLLNTVSLCHCVTANAVSMCEVRLLMHLDYKITHRGSSASGVAADDVSRRHMS